MPGERRKHAAREGKLEVEIGDEQHERAAAAEMARRVEQPVGIPPLERRARSRAAMRAPCARECIGGEVSDSRTRASAPTKPKGSPTRHADCAALSASSATVSRFPPPAPKAIDAERSATTYSGTATLSVMVRASHWPSGSVALRRRSIRRGSACASKGRRPR